MSDECNGHLFIEYTYKKITPCNLCSQVLRGDSNIILTLKTIIPSYSPSTVQVTQSRDGSANFANRMCTRAAKIRCTNMIRIERNVPHSPLDFGVASSIV